MAFPVYRDYDTVSILLCLDTGWKCQGVCRLLPYGGFNPLMSGYGLEANIHCFKENRHRRFQSSYVWIRAGSKHFISIGIESYRRFNPLMSGYGLEVLVWTDCLLLRYHAFQSSYVWIRAGSLQFCFQ